MQREYYIGFGLIFLLMSALIITFALSSTTNEKPVVVDSKEKSWSVCGTINAGEKFFLYIVPPAKWHTGVAEAPTDYYPYGYIDVIVEIVNSSGRTVAKFLYTWAKAKNLYTGASFIAAANVTVLFNDGLIDPGAIEVGAIGGCGGIASYTDNYTVRICDIVPPIYYQNPSYSDPPTLELIKAKSVMEHPNIYVLWLGAPLLILGLYLLLHPPIKKKKVLKS
ncbi:MAG: hypothetical protein QW660_03235 [Candidatus Bathyarchaeia archaeon]